MTLEISLRASAQGFESLSLRQTKQTPTGRLFRFFYGGIRTGAVVNDSTGVLSEPTLTEPAGESEFLPLRQIISRIPVFRVRLIHIMSPEVERRNARGS